MLDREQSVAKMQDPSLTWDIAVIGGGATGIGVAVDAASRGYSVCLFEQSDFGKGTSSRSTKLIHGGVRYLRQGNISLVLEALKERAALRENAPHLVSALAFIIPCYKWWETPFYGIGLKIYDLLSMGRGFGRTQLLSKKELIARVPNIQQAGLRGGVLYYDGQFDDARLLIALAQTAAQHGAALINYCPVVALTHDPSGSGQLNGLVVKDIESKKEYAIRARCVVNATGAFSDGVRKLDDPKAGATLSPSQGIHLVLDRTFLPGDAAIMIPKTSDGRVMFAIPWHDHTLLGTTDTPVSNVSLEPRAQESEIEFLLNGAARYLAKRPARSDILSVFTGIRPLLKAANNASTSSLARDHIIEVAPSKLLSISGGKWTTYRKMAQDCVDHAIGIAGLEKRPCKTHVLQLHGYCKGATARNHLAAYGSDSETLNSLISREPELGLWMGSRIPFQAVQVVWAARQEMARTVDDVLSRRLRTLFLDSEEAAKMAPAVAQLLAKELNRDQKWQSDQLAEFESIAQNYRAGPAP